jgi:hypothetical protein
MKTIFLGDTGWDGSISPTGDDWQSFGFNIDGLHYTDACEAQYHCQLQPGGDAEHAMFDGPMGLDNSFGRNILPFLEGLSATPSPTQTAVLESGAYSLVIQLEKLGAGSDYGGLHAQVFEARGSDVNGGTSDSPTPPTDGQWENGSYVWHPYADSLSDPSVTDPSMYQSTERYQDSFLTGNKWSSGSKGTIHLRLALSGNVIDLVIYQAVMELQLSPDHTTGTHGILGGVVSVQELGKAIAANEIGLGIGDCPENPATIGQLIAQVAVAADMNLDGTQHPDEPCDAISIGIGFTTENATLGAPAPALGIYDPCGSVGGSGGSGG